ncbi:PIN domain protein [uncultured archaeon]|nr:PIN domain protein [uncultured archaeon]
MLSRRFLFDSSALTLYFMGESEKVRALVEEGDADLYCSVLSFYEVPKSMMKKGIDRATIGASVDIMRRRFKIAGLSEGLCLKAAQCSIEHGLYAIDSMIYGSAAEKGATLVTADADFRKKRLKNVMLV